MDGRLTRTNYDEAGDYVVPNVISPRDLGSNPDNMDETILSSSSVRFIICDMALKFSAIIHCHLMKLFSIRNCKK